MKILFLFTFFLILFSLRSGLQAQESTDRVPASLIQDVENEVHTMSLEDRVGQLFIFGFSGTHLNEKLKATIKQVKPGSLILFGRNIDSAYQVALLNYNIKKFAEENNIIKPFLAVDQEGGDVARIQTYPPLPSGLALGNTNNINLTNQVGFVTGNLLRGLGFNMDLAPVLDLSDATKPSFIGTRAFGSDPQKVSHFANAFAEGLLKAGILPTGKHFPGHGGIIQDSHKVLPQKMQTTNELVATDALPFKNFLTKNPTKALMVAHLSFPSIDSSSAPATFSSKLTHQILREKLLYEGIVMTDDIEMGGVQSFGTVQDRAVKAFHAGADIIMVAWTSKAQLAAYGALLNDIKKHPSYEDQMNESVKRILIAKRVIFRESEAGVPDLKKISALLKVKQIRETAGEVLFINFENEMNSIEEVAKKISPLKGPALIFSTENEFYTSFTNAQRYRKARFFKLTQLTKISNVTAFASTYSNSPLIFYVTGTRTSRLIKKLPASLKEHILVVNASDPGLFRDKKQFAGVINIFTNNPISGGLVMKYIVLNKKKKEPLVTSNEPE